MCAGTKPKRRSRNRLELVTDILDITRDGAYRTEIMHKARLSFTGLNVYVNLLLETGLIKEVSRGKRTLYYTTEKGFEYARSFYEVVDTLGTPTLKTQTKIKRVKSALNALEASIKDLESYVTEWIDCPHCKKKTQADSKYCSQCGKPLLAEAKVFTRLKS